MELKKALDQISEIHGHLAKTEVYRGYRSIPVGAAALAALCASLVQATVFPAQSEHDFLSFWVGVALIGVAISSSELVYNYLFRYSTTERRHTRRVLGQFAPSLGAALVLTFALAESPDAVRWIPGLWALAFSTGVFAIRPYLPRTVGYVGLYYQLSAVALLGLAANGNVFSPWSLGIVFGIGQLLMAVVLYWNIERSESHD